MLQKKVEIGGFLLKNLKILSELLIYAPVQFTGYNISLFDVRDSNILITVLLIFLDMGVVVLGCTALTRAAVTVRDLRCEYKVNPWGIDTIKPRLNWVINLFF